MRRFPLFLLTFGLVTLPFAAHASEMPGDSIPAKRDSTKKSPGPILDSVHVVDKSNTGYVARNSSSATKTSTPLRDVPQSITVITHDLMTDRHMQSMADVVRYVPGITMAQGEGNRDQPTIRGNTTSSDFYVDGVRDDIQYYRDLYNIDRVDALTGPSAMIFGRGSGGGVLNRVTKQASWTPIRELTLQDGSYNDRRASVDVGQGVTKALAVRMNGMYEHSGFYRDDFRFTRYGINPTATFSPGTHSSVVTASYEHFHDHRTADRGIPSFNGLPFNTDVSTFFGDPDVSHANANVDAGDVTFSHTTLSGLSIRNHTRLAAYDKLYQNVYPGAVNPAGTDVAIVAYNNAARRHNLFNQTDLTYGLTTGSLSHTLLVGAEVGRQVTDNFRNTGYFNNTTTTVTAPVSDPTVSVPVTFRQSATDADNHLVTTANSVYAQDQLAMTSQLQLVAGLRAQLFDLRYHNNRGDTTRTRLDHLLSPKAGIVFTPVEQLALYTSYSVSYLPSSGDQFSSLTSITQALQPEKFTNAEVGTKWQALDRLALTAAVYRLDRTNTRAPSPADPAVVVQTGKARSSGAEFSAMGEVTSSWQIVGTYTNQNAKIINRTSSSSPGATVAIVPHTVASVWNKVRVLPRWSLGLGASRQSAMYAAIDNTVTLPGYTRVDAATFFSVSQKIRAQINVDNVLNTRYYFTADNNNNITPGAPRTVGVSVTTGF